jgi:hypothetical protein
MNQRKLLLFALPFIVLCFVLIFSFGFQKTRQGQVEVEKIHRAAELAIEAYLKDRRISGVTYNSLPIQYDKDRCILGCRVDTADESGVKSRTEFDILFRREKTIWKAAIVTIEKDLPIPNEAEKTAPWSQKAKGK